MPLGFGGVPVNADAVALDQRICTGQPSADFQSIFNGSFDEYLFKLFSVAPVTNAVDLYMRLSNDGGSYDSNSKYVNSLFAFNSSGTGVAGEAAGSPVAQWTVRKNSEITNDINYGVTGYVVVANPSSTLYKRAWGRFAYQASTVLQSVIWNGVYQISTPVTGIRFIFSSGAMANGLIRAYGIRGVSLF